MADRFCCPSWLPVLLLTLLLSACGTEWNDPYPADERGGNRLYSAFAERPKHLDPAVSYTDSEIGFIAQIYEPPLQYHYLKRPYVLIPATLTAMPQIRYLSKTGGLLPESAPAEQVARTVYRMSLRQDVRYQPHPAFSVNSDGSPRYHALSAAEAKMVQGATGPMALADPGTRLLKAQDYVYQIKRLAHPAVQSPIYGTMAAHILGLDALAGEIRAAQSAAPGAWVDLDTLSLPGAVAIDDHTLEITLAGDEFFCARTARGGSVLQSAGAAQWQCPAGYLAGRHRTLHDGGQQSERPNRSGAQPQLS